MSDDVKQVEPLPDVIGITISASMAKKLGHKDGDILHVDGETIKIQVVGRLPSG